MRNLLRVLASVAVLAAALLLLDVLCYRPYQCNKASRTAMKEALAAFDSVDRLHAADLARKSLARVEPCLSRVPYMIELYVIAAVDYRALGQPGVAVKLYRRALEYDRRPELYLQLGLTELELNHRAEARRVLELAILFDVSMLDEVVDPELHQILAKIAKQ